MCVLVHGVDGGFLDHAWIVRRVQGDFTAKKRVGGGDAGRGKRQGVWPCLFLLCLFSFFVNLRFFEASL